MALRPISPAGCSGRSLLVPRGGACLPSGFSPTLCDPVDCSPPLLCPWDTPGKHTGVGCDFLLQEIFPGIEPTSLTSPVLAGRFFHLGSPGGGGLEINEHCLSSSANEAFPATGFFPPPFSSHPLEWQEERQPGCRGRDSRPQTPSLVSYISLLLSFRPTGFSPGLPCASVCVFLLRAAAQRGPRTASQTLGLSAEGRVPDSSGPEPAEQLAGCLGPSQGRLRWPFQPLFTGTPASGEKIPSKGGDMVLPL